MVFQPTLPHRERQTSREPCPATGAFQPTLPHRERRLQNVAPPFEDILSTHAPAQGATRITVVAGMIRCFQPTLPHRERHGVLLSSGVDAGLSTHAPAQGATGGHGGGYVCSDLSTHAPAQGATCSISRRDRPPVFQPTLPHRERQQKDTKSTLSFCAKQKRIFWITFLKIY